MAGTTYTGERLSDEERAIVIAALETRAYLAREGAEHRRSSVWTAEVIERHAQRVRDTEALLRKVEDATHLCVETIGLVQP
jgi:hypothetical protein